MGERTGNGGGEQKSTMVTESWWWRVQLHLLWNNEGNVQVHRPVTSRGKERHPYNTSSCEAGSGESVGHAAWEGEAGKRQCNSQLYVS